jgi:hypothetical protein
VSALLLYGIVGLEGADSESLAPDTTLVAFRDLGAVTAPTVYVRQEPGERDVAVHRSVVEAIFARRAFLPAPVGIIFRNRDALVRWLELHYVTLSDGLTFVEGRVAARVHLSARNEIGEETDVAAAATEAFRLLRQHAAASVSLKPADGPRSASAAFLVERDRWSVFVETVASEARTRPTLEFRHTGPWPPYDFVNMQFGV